MNLERIKFWDGSADVESRLKSWNAGVEKLLIVAQAMLQDILQEIGQPVLQVRTAMASLLFSKGGNLKQKSKSPNADT